MTAYEIVQVVNSRSLIDAEAYQRAYVTRDNGALSPGYYVVMWPEGTAQRVFNAEAEYFGPFKIALHAKLRLARCLVEFDAKRSVPADAPPQQDERALH